MITHAQLLAKQARIEELQAEAAEIERDYPEYMDCPDEVQKIHEDICDELGELRHETKPW